MSKADELRLLREAIKSLPDAVAVRNADAATFRAKQLGRNQIRFFARAG